MSGTLRLKGSTSGYSELQAPAVAGDQTFILPVEGGTLLTTDSPFPTLTLESGTVTSPSLTFEGDSNTGIYSPGADELAITTGGGQRLFVDSSGNIGIGTDSPGSTLEIASNSNTALRITDTTGSYSQILYNDDGSSVSALVIGVDAGNTSTAASAIRLEVDGTERMRIDSGGNVGIGTSNPTALLEIESSGSGNAVGPVYSLMRNSASPANNDKIGVIHFDGKDSLNNRVIYKSVYGQIDSTTSGSTEGSLVVGSDDSSANQQVVIDGSGYVGLGESLPDIRLHLKGAGSTNSSVRLENTSGPNTQQLVPGVVGVSNTGFSIYDVDNTTTTFRIDSSGNVGIGTDSPANKLQVSGEIRGGRNTLQYISIFGDASNNKLSAISQSGNSKAFVIAADSNSTSLQLRVESANPLLFQTNNTERMRIDSDGNVGIGTSSPFGKLHVQDDSNNLEMFLIGPSGGSSRIRFGDSADTNIGQIIYDNTNNSLQIHANNAERMRVNSSGAVGIGTTNPTATLHVQNNSNTPGEDLQSWTADLGTNVRSANLIAPEADNGNDPFIFQTGNSWQFRVDATDALRIDTAGKVGIGTTSPDRLVHIQKGDAGSAPSDSNTVLMVENSTHSIIQMASPNNVSNRICFGDPQDADVGRLTYDHGSNDFSINVNASERMRINSSGNVGIGTTSPDCRLHIVDGLTGGQLLVANNDTNSSEKYGSFGTVHYTNSEQPAIGIASQSSSSANTILIGGGLGEFNAATDIRFFTAANNTTTTGTQHLAIKPDGTIRYNQDSTNTPGFGNTTTGLSVEHVSSGAAVFISRNDSSPLFLNRNNDGIITAYYRSGSQEGYINITTTGVSLVSTSDYRLKENAVSITDGITRVKQLQPKRFNFIADPLTTVDGFMAHEVQTVVPEATFGEQDAVDAEGNLEYQGLDQSKLIPLLTAALQEAIAKIETLETKVAALEAGS